LQAEQPLQAFAMPRARFAGVVVDLDRAVVATIDECRMTNERLPAAADLK